MRRLTCRRRAAQSRGGLTPRSRRRPPASFACLRSRLNSNVRALLFGFAHGYGSSSGRVPPRCRHIARRRSMVSLEHDHPRSFVCHALAYASRAGWSAAAGRRCLRPAGTLRLAAFMSFPSVPLLRHSAVPYCCSSKASLEQRFLSACLPPSLRATLCPNRSFERTCQRLLRTLCPAAQLQR